MTKGRRGQGGVRRPATHLGRGGRGPHLLDPLRRVRPPEAPRHRAPALKPTVAEILATPTNLTFRLNGYDPDFPTYGLDDIIDCAEDAPELEALHRWAMVLHNQYPWDRSQAALVEAGQLQDDDYVVAFHPRDQEVRSFLRRLASGHQPVPAAPAREATPPGAALPDGGRARPVRGEPRIEALAVVHGDGSAPTRT